MWLLWSQTNNFCIVATVLTVYGIETRIAFSSAPPGMIVATVLTVYGIETIAFSLPVLRSVRLQQYLPFTVLKLSQFHQSTPSRYTVATVLTVYGIETEVTRKDSASNYAVATVLTVYGIET